MDRPCISICANDIYSGRARIAHSALDAWRHHSTGEFRQLTTVTRLRTFVTEFTRLIDAVDSHDVPFLKSATALLEELIRTDDWLPPEFAAANPFRYQQYLLHCDPLQRFSVVSFVWDKGQETPIHDHTVWGLIGVLRGAELSTRYECQGPSRPLRTGAAVLLEQGQIDVVSPTIGDIHRVANAYPDRVSVSIHVYGANIGAVRRSTFNRTDGTRREFISGYANDLTPNLWDQST